MKKVYIGGNIACSVHSEKEMLESIVESCETAEQTDNYQEADLIVLTDMCIGTYKQFEESVKIIKKIFDEKKEDSSVIVSGCISKGINFSLMEEQQEMLEKTKIIQPDQILEYITRLLVDEEELTADFLEDLRLPFTVYNHFIRTSIVQGCLNKCSFCKTNYMNFDLKSVPMESIKRFIRQMNNELKAKAYLALCSSNLSLYGVDLYKEQKAHEAIHLLTSAEKVQWASAGALINFYPELVKEIIENEKIKHIFTSLESGSPRIYELMNRPISLDKWIETVKTIKEHRPDIIIETEAICGFPTETIDDFKRTLALIKELDINPLFLHPYEDSPQIPSHKLPQKSDWYIYFSKNYGDSQLYGLYNKYQERIANDEQFIIYKFDEEKCYQTMQKNGHTRNILFSQLDQDYEVGEIIPPNSIKPKQYAKRIK